MKKAIEDEEYVKKLFMLGKYYRGQGDRVKKQMKRLSENGS
jgi:hypothetical protein